MLASYHGHAPLASLLLKHGADPNRLNDRGQSPLAGVVFKNEAEVIKILLEGGADPEIGTPSALDSTKVSLYLSGLHSPPFDIPALDGISPSLHKEFADQKQHTTPTHVLKSLPTEIGLVSVEAFTVQDPQTLPGQPELIDDLPCLRTSFPALAPSHLTSPNGMPSITHHAKIRVFCFGLFVYPTHVSSLPQT
jgi:hypothetical protein